MVLPYEQAEMAAALRLFFRQLEEAPGSFAADPAYVRQFERREIASALIRACEEARSAGAAASRKASPR